MYYTKITPNNNQKINGVEDIEQHHKMSWLFYKGYVRGDREFVFRVSEEENCYYMYSKESPVDAVKDWTIKTRLWNPNITNGSTWDFLIRCSPVIIKRCDDNPYKRRIKRHCIIKNTIKEYERVPANEWPRDIPQTSMYRWFESQRTYIGFKVKNLQLREYFSRIQFKGEIFSHKDNSNIEKMVIFSAVDVMGTLEVFHTDKFKQILIKGLGSQKCYGFGMLMIKPHQQLL